MKRKNMVAILVLCTTMAIAVVGGVVASSGDESARQEKKENKATSNQLPIVLKGQPSADPGMMSEAVKQKISQGSTKALPIARGKSALNSPTPATETKVSATTSKMDEKLGAPPEPVKARKNTRLSTLTTYGSAPWEPVSGGTWAQLAGWNVDQVMRPVAIPTNSSAFIDLFPAYFASSYVRLGITKGASSTDTHAFVEANNGSGKTMAARGSLCTSSLSGTNQNLRCSVKYPFTSASTLWLRTWRLDDTATGSWWGYWIIDHSTGRETYIASIFHPRVRSTTAAHPALFYPIYTTVSHYAPNTCATASSVHVMNPALDNRTRFHGINKKIYNPWYYYPRCGGVLNGVVKTDSPDSVSTNGWHEIKTPARW